ncbi:MAG: STN domain-containing protein [Dysgonamonadaceae bacterium]|jgi:type II secretory pathway component GspD/PulD (secretin)|nr:STN domain-containing protein [Dysgonamonadaceae bacterium]
MKNTKRALGCLLFFFIAAYQIPASAQVTVSANNTSIKQVIRQIEKSSGYSFFYSDDALDLDKQISVEITNESIELSLDKIFKGMDINYAIGENKQVMLTAGKKNEQTPVPSQNKKKIFRRSERRIGRTGYRS